MLSHLSLTIWWGGYYSSFINLRNLRGGKDTNLHLSEIKVHMYLWKYEAKGEETVTNFSDVAPTSCETRVTLRARRVPGGSLNSRWSDLACGLEGSAEDEPGANRQGVPAGLFLVLHRELLSPLFQQRPLLSAAITMGISDTAVLQHKKLLQWVGPQVSLLSLQSQGLSRVFSNTMVLSLLKVLLMVQLSHPYMTLGKPQPRLDWPLLAKRCLWFLICCLGLSQLFFQGASVF